MPTPKSKRTTSPAYQFYPDRFLTDDKVLLMSFTEIGVYQVLLCHAWPHRGLPNDTAAIAKMLKMPHARFKKMWSGPVGQCFVLKGGRYVNPRQEKEREKQADYRQRQADNAAKGWQSRGSATALPESHTSGNARVIETETLPALDQKKKGDAAQFRADEALRQLRDKYPPNRVTSGHLTERAFWDAIADDPAHRFAQLMANLENNIRSHEWHIKGLIPSMQKWLSEGLWLRQLPSAAPAIEQPSGPQLPEWARKARERKAAQS